VCRPSHAASAAYGRRTTRKAFSTQKEKIGGGNLKKCKGFFWRGAFQLCWNRRRGLPRSAFFLKIGSSEVVKSHQIEV
jgi:hypothetical protein